MIAILIADGFEEVEALTVVDYLRRVELDIKMVNVKNTDFVTGSHGIEVKTDLKISDLKISDLKLDDCKAVILPGGIPNSTTLRDDVNVIKVIKTLYERGDIVAAICAAPIALERAGILEGKTITSHPSVKEEFKNVNYIEEKVAVDKNIITSRSAGVAIDFALKLVEILKSKKESEELAKSLLYRG